MTNPPLYRDQAQAQMLRDIGVPEDMIQRSYPSTHPTFPIEALRQAQAVLLTEIGVPLEFMDNPPQKRK